MTNICEIFFSHFCWPSNF